MGVFASVMVSSVHLFNFYPHPLGAPAFVGGHHQPGGLDDQIGEDLAHLYDGMRGVVLQPPAYEADDG